jgi:hypothetical protein
VARISSFSSCIFFWALSCVDRILSPSPCMLFEGGVSCVREPQARLWLVSCALCAIIYIYNLYSYSAVQCTRHKLVKSKKNPIVFHFK